MPQGICPKEMRAEIQTGDCTSIFIVVVFTLVKMWTNE